MAVRIMTTEPVYWSALSSGAVVHGGLITEPGGAVASTTLIAAEGEVAFLEAVHAAAPDVSTWDPLPAFGELVEAGGIYAYAGGLVIARQSHLRTEHAPETIPALFAVWRADAGAALEWVANEWVGVGTRRLHNGVLYTALQAHQTQVDQEPDAPGILGVLWGVVATTPEWAVGVAYAVNDEVTYQGATYRCLQAHTSIATWYPSAPGILGVLWVAI